MKKSNTIFIALSFILLESCNYNSSEEYIMQLYNFEKIDFAIIYKEGAKSCEDFTNNDLEKLEFHILDANHKKTKNICSDTRDCNFSNTSINDSYQGRLPDKLYKVSGIFYKTRGNNENVFRISRLDYIENLNITDNYYICR